MRVVLLPSGAGAAPPGQYLTTFVVDGEVAIDAGSLGFVGDPPEQARVHHVFLTHSHMDHVASLPMFLENVYQACPDCVTVHATADCLDCLRRDVFNGRLFPDFITLSEQTTPFLRLSELRPGVPVEAAGLRLTAVGVDHVVPTVGYLIEGPGAAAAVVTDTAPTDEVWRLARQTPNLKAVFLELTFPDSMEWLAEVSKHLTTSRFERELAKLPAGVRVYAVHLKPRHQAEVVAELAARRLPNVAVARPGEVYEIG